MADPQLCRLHRSILTTLKRRLGRRHNGHRVARHTLATIAKQCPTCPKEIR